ncbi:MAG: L-lactate dehydrogenase complex protein LldE [Kiritimatiellia bacterium]|jgi:L-lactate dehydrogenase complex protein LldE
MMKVGLFIPCYMDVIYPDAAMATLKLLEQFVDVVEYPTQQTCCGQPMANTGCVDDAKPVAEHFIKTFTGYDYIVCPSGSCTSMVRNHYHGLVPDDPETLAIRNKTYELCEFMTDILKVSELKASFPHKVGIHQACHGLRELRLGSSSERRDPKFSKLRQLLDLVKDIEIVDLKRVDECCGFGGTFSVNEEAISALMGKNRVADHEQAGAEYIVSADMSCLMHMQGLIKRAKKPMQVKHIAEILVAGADA